MKVQFAKRILFYGFFLAAFGSGLSSAETLRYHTLVLDGQSKIIPWYSPVENAFDNYLEKCWAWALSAPHDSHGLPISFLYCAWKPGNDRCHSSASGSCPDRRCHPPAVNFRYSACHLFRVLWKRGWSFAAGVFPASGACRLSARQPHHQAAW